METPERRKWRCWGVLIVNFEHISQIVLVFPSLALNKNILAGLVEFLYDSKESKLMSLRKGLNAGNSKDWFDDLLKGPLPDLSRFLATESLLKWWKIFLAISPKRLFSFWRCLKFCSDFFGHVGKWPDKKYKVNFKIYDVIQWETNNYNTFIAQYLKK